MQVTVNGKLVELPANASVAELLARLKFDAARVAVERNHEVVPRRTYGEARLSEGDRLEVVGFVGGG